MKSIILMFVVSFIFAATNVQAVEEEYLRQLLRSQDWKDRAEGIYIIYRNVEKYQDNDLVKRDVLHVLSLENEEYKYLSRNHLIRGDDGQGEFYLNLLDLVIDLDIPDSTEVLLDSVGHGGSTENALAERLLQEGEEELGMLQSIQEKVQTSDVFYEDIRSGYFRIIQKYLEKQPTMSQRKEALVKEIVLNGLFAEGRTERIYAIQCSHYFPELIQEVLPKLIDRATTETDLYVRRVSIEALGEIGDPKGLPVLTEALEDKEPEIRQAAVYAFSKLKDPSVISLLIEMLNDPDGMVRRQAVWELGQIGTTAAIPSLEKLAVDDPYTREIDADQAKSWGFDEQREGKYYIYPVRRTAKEALKKIEEKMAPEPTPTPLPIESSVTWLIKTVPPSPEPTVTPSPVPTGEPKVQYSRSLTPLPTAPGPTGEPQGQSAQQPPAEPESVPSIIDLKNIGILTVIAVVVIGVIGYMVYRMKSQRK